MVDSLKTGIVGANSVRAAVSKVLLSLLVHLSFRYIPKLAQGGKGLLCPRLGVVDVSAYKSVTEVAWTLLPVPSVSQTLHCSNFGFLFPFFTLLQQ